MNQKIFELGLSVETVSVYLMCCSLTDTDATISTKKLSEMWNSTRASLLEALKDLETRNILRRIISDRAGNTVYKLADVKNWKLL
jgi:predicted transcriptional regulator